MASPASLANPLANPEEIFLLNYTWARAEVHPASKISCGACKKNEGNPDWRAHLHMPEGSTKPELHCFHKRCFIQFPREGDFRQCPTCKTYILISSGDSKQDQKKLLQHFLESALQSVKK